MGWQPSPPEVVVTGVGVVSPIGIGVEAFWASLGDGQSGVRNITRFDTRGTPIRFGAEVHNFEPCNAVRPKKILKLTSPGMQFGILAADLALQHADLNTFDPERAGVVYGGEFIHWDVQELERAFRASMVNGRFEFSRWGEYALPECFPLMLLKCQPNLTACHVSIAHDFRGPCNTIIQTDVSSLWAVIEAVRIIQRGTADVVIAGGTGSRITPVTWVRSAGEETSRRRDDPERASRPFDLDRDGFVNGEGAAAFVLESRQHADGRKGRILARVLGTGRTCEPHPKGKGLAGSGLARAIVEAISEAGISSADVGHVNADGLSTCERDRAEARALSSVLSNVPVTAPKSFFGYLGSGTGAVEMAVSVLALERNLVPVTLNYETADPTCPVNVVHTEPLVSSAPAAITVNQSDAGQAIAVCLGRPA